MILNGRNTAKKMFRYNYDYETLITETENLLNILEERRNSNSIPYWESYTNCCTEKKEQFYTQIELHIRSPLELEVRIETKAPIMVVAKKISRLF